MNDAGGQRLRVAFLSNDDPLNVRAFSGTVFHMVQALQAVMPDLEIVRYPRPHWFDRFAHIVSELTKGRATPHYWRVLNRLSARRLARRWRGQRVLVIGVVNAAIVSELAALVPVLNVTDATFEIMRNFYPHFAAYDARTAQAAEEIEERSILLSVHNSFSSGWAADSAVRHYGALPDRVSVDSWGSNIPDVPAEAVRASDANRDRCRLLFIGVDWTRKGGDVVCAAGEILAARGFAVHIDIVGSAPPGGVPSGAWLEDHGFLSKAKPEEAARLASLIHDADFLFLPTWQDTFGMVFGEANAYGTPAITRSVGGVGDVVRNHVNGLALPQEAQPVDFADAIEGLWNDRAGYLALRESSRREYEQRLNWHCWANRIIGIIVGLEASGQA